MTTSSVEFRRYPYPYQAMLSICSDLDETQDWDTYVEIVRFLNSAESTRMGEGVDLEIGNTMYFAMNKEDLSYWNLSELQREQCRNLIRSGHIDCLHSYGDTASSRLDAQRTLEELARHQCNLRVWVDHASAPTNIGADIMFGHGDEVGHPAYHADLSIRYGFKYFWLGRVTSHMGQNTRYRPSSMIDGRFPLQSGKRVAKDILKISMAEFKRSRYHTHRRNKLLHWKTLRDGQKTLEFIRCDPHPQGISVGDTAKGMAEVLTQRNLNALVAGGGSSIIYTHLGKALSCANQFPTETVKAFQRLREFSVNGDILVTTTRRLLDYASSFRQLNSGSIRLGSNNSLEVTMPGIDTFAGFTFYSEQPNVVLIVNGEKVKNLIRNPPDETGRMSYSVGWRPLHLNMS